MTFGEKLRQEREGKGMTRHQLADASGVTFGSIHGYELGRRAPSFENVVRLAKALGVDCTAFADCEDISGEPEPPKSEPGSAHPIEEVPQRAKGKRK